MLLMKIKEKSHFSRVYEDEQDPLSGGRGVGMIVSRRILCCFGIPVSGEPAKVRAYSLNGKDFAPALPEPLSRVVTVKPENSPPIPVLLWTEGMKNRADEILPLAGSRWKYNWFLPLMGLALLLLAAWGLVFAGLTAHNPRKEQAACQAHPRPGDILVAQACQQQDNFGKASLTAFEIAEIRADTLFPRQSDKRGPGPRVCQLPEIRAAALDFPPSGNRFSSEAKPFARPFKVALERLASLSMPDVNIDVKYAGHNPEPQGARS